MDEIRKQRYGYSQILNDPSLLGLSKAAPSMIFDRSIRLLFTNQKDLGEYRLAYGRNQRYPAFWWLKGNWKL